MELTSNFAEWINGLDLNNYETVYSLYRSVLECDEYGPFSTEKSKGRTSQWIVKTDSHCLNPLFLANDKIKRAFLNFLENEFCDELNMEGWYIMNKSKFKNFYI